ncbi:MAG: hypothetical protein V4577_27610 [Bacteroidota bacterium]
MSTILKQRNFVLTQIFEITDNSLIVRSKTPTGFSEAQFRFEDITKQTYRVKKAKTMSIIGFCCSFFITIVLYFSWIDNSKEMPLAMVAGAGCVTIICALGAFFIRENYIQLFLVNGSFLKFFATSPNSKEVDEFMEIFFEQQKKYLLGRYARADEYLNPEQLSAGLQWLWNRNFIEDEELNELRLKILPKPSPSSPMGFQFNQSPN